MASATRTAASRPDLDLDQYSQDELDTLLFTDQETDRPQASYNLPAMMGVVTLLVTLLYVVGEVGGAILPFLANALDFTMVAPLALAAGAATVFATVMKPRRRRRERRQARVNIKKTDGKRGEGLRIGLAGSTGAGRGKLMKSRKGKIAGVAGGIAEHFGWDPAWVRAAFVLAAFLTQGVAIPLYILLAVVLPKPEPVSLEERIRIIRDS